MRTGNIYHSDLIVSFKLGQFFKRASHHSNLQQQVENWIDAEHPDIAEWLRTSTKGYYALSWTRTIFGWPSNDSAITIVLKLEDTQDIAMFKLFFVGENGRVEP